MEDIAIKHVYKGCHMQNMLNLKFTFNRLSYFQEQCFAIQESYLGLNVKRRSWPY